MICIPWVPFNINVPGRRQEGSSIIKLIEMRGWARNLKTIYRGRKVELWWEGVGSRGPRLASTREGHPGGGSCSVRCLSQRAPLRPRSAEANKWGLLGASARVCDYSSPSSKR